MGKIEQVIAAAAWILFSGMWAGLLLGLYIKKAVDEREQI